MTDNNKEWIVTPGLSLPVERFANLYKVAKDLPIMIIGATGSGKSLFVHIYEKLYKEEYKKNAKTPVRLNCAAFGKDLILSELFGHVKGAFTGATSEKKGHINKADGGVLILEEIGEIPETGQEQLLTFIEDGYYYKVGDTKKERANVKIITTTNKSKEDFREDFWYRFFPFYVPPLHERRDDILYYLAIKFPDVVKYLEPWHILTLLCYNWPGNVRELERVALLARWEFMNEESYLAEIGNAFGESGKDRYKADIFWKCFDFTWKRGFSDPGHRDHFSYGTIQLETQLQEFGVNVDLLNRELKKGCLQLGWGSTKQPFKNIDHLEWERDVEIEERFGVSAYLRMKLFGDIEAAFKHYCYAFLQDDRSDHILFNVREEYIPHFFLLGYITTEPLYDAPPADDVFRLLKKIFEFVTETKLPTHIKSFPHEYSPEDKEIKSIINELELNKYSPQTPRSDDEFKIAKKIIANMSGTQLEKLHNEALLKRTGGNKSQAAKLKGMSPTGFLKRLKKHNPNLLSP